ncbi:MAG TPA: malonic semialdehyde reductase [Fimbriimonas sp.]|nr:malonic semialdehyde reductase [Fimbriimonas sp.]
MIASDLEGSRERSLEDAELDLLFREARTYYKWLPKDVTDQQLHRIYGLMKWGPTSANASPARIVFLRTEEAKARLLPALAALNVEKAKTAPVVAIIAYDVEFYENLPKLMPHVDAKAWFEGNADLINETAFRNSSLQGAYFMMAARAVGLDCGPMSGFDQEKVNQEFFPSGKTKVNFIVNLGYGDKDGLWPRLPRLEFDEAATVL